MLILAYHAIGHVAPEDDPNHLVIAPDVFRAQVRSLLRRGIEFVPMREWRPGVCALTFDDGCCDDAVAALDGLPATFYVNPGLDGVPHDTIRGLRTLTVDEIAALPENIEVGAHTLRHTALADASHAFALREMVASREAIEQLRGTCTTFAYPQCAYSPACPAAAREAGYTTAVTCGSRGSLAPFELRRVAIDSLENRLTWELKSRDLWRHVFDSVPGRVARRAARPFRHGMLR